MKTPDENMQLLFEAMSAAQGAVNIINEDARVAVVNLASTLRRKVLLPLCVIFDVRYVRMPNHRFRLEGSTTLPEELFEHLKAVLNTPVFDNNKMFDLIETITPEELEAERNKETKH